MKLVVRIGIVLALVAVNSTVWAQSKTVIMGVYEWEPYVDTAPGNHGLLAEVIMAALGRMGYSVKVESYPFSRAMIQLQQGKIDILPGVSYTFERGKTIDFSTPYYDVDMVVVFKKGRISYNSLSDLQQYRGGVMAGTFWEGELKMHGVEYESVPTQEHNIKKLVADRIDFACMPREIALHIMARLGEDPKKYEFALYKRDPQPAGISKKTKVANLREDFEAGLELIKNDGSYERIVSGK